MSGAPLTARDLSISPSAGAYNIELEFEHKARNLVLLGWDDERSTQWGSCSEVAAAVRREEENVPEGPAWTSQTQK